jgi:hypothetical protein
MNWTIKPTTKRRIPSVGISNIWISLLLPIHYKSFFESFHYQYSVDAYISQ